MTPTNRRPSIRMLRECFRYEDGKLFYRERPRHHFRSDNFWKGWNTRSAGREAGTIQAGRKGKKRCKITLDAFTLRRYQIVWVLHHDEWPEQIDHVNRDSLDDRIENLRLASTPQNTANAAKHSDNTSGHKGVYYRKDRRKWFSRVMVNGKARHLGTFDSPDAARMAYEAAARMIYGEFFFSG